MLSGLGFHITVKDGKENLLQPRQPVDTEIKPFTSRPLAMQGTGFHLSELNGYEEWI